MSCRRICSRRFDPKTPKLTEAPWCVDPDTFADDNQPNRNADTGL